MGPIILGPPEGSETFRVVAQKIASRALGRVNGPTPAALAVPDITNLFLHSKYVLIWQHNG